MNSSINTLKESADSGAVVLEDPRYAQLKLSTIMMVDDDPVMLEIIQALLEEEGYQRFINIEDSRLAIDQLIEADPDIMLLDLDMPNVNGFEVLQSVRAHEHFQYLPVIILTASENPDNKLRALELGATDFLSKPVDPSELALRVRNTLSAKAYQDQLAYYDSLTGLPNRKLFIDRLGWGMEFSKREQHQLVLLDVGLDRFRSISETLGLSTGDYIIQTVAERLNSVLRSSDVVGRGDKMKQRDNIARIGGEEFSIVLYGDNSVENAAIISQRVLDVIEKVFTIGENDVYLSASIGIAVYPEDGRDVETLVKHAGAAKDFARKQDGENYQFYSSKMNDHSRALMRMESELRKALKQETFQLFYQPKVETRSGKIMGMETLMRWVHHEDGNISPSYFIPIAEDMGLIVEMGEWVLFEACRRASEWFVGEYSDLKVSVNVSVQQFRHAGFKESVSAALKASGLNPKNLVLEITESMLMGDVDSYVCLLKEIEALGVSFSLDDFGTGYSSLSYLKKFPISELKIDRSFLNDVPANNDDNSIVRAIIAMAHSLGQKVVAEGVENADQLDFLLQHDCDIIQGYYYSKALNRSDFSKYLTLKG